MTATALPTARIPIAMVKPVMTVSIVTEWIPVLPEVAPCTPATPAHSAMRVAAPAMRRRIPVRDVLPMMIVTAYVIPGHRLPLAADQITAPSRAIPARKTPTRLVETVWVMRVIVKETSTVMEMLTDPTHLYSRRISAEAL